MMVRDLHTPLLHHISTGTKMAPNLGGPRAGGAGGDEGDDASNREKDLVPPQQPQPQHHGPILHACPGQATTCNHDYGSASLQNYHDYKAPTSSSPWPSSQGKKALALGSAATTPPPTPPAVQRRRQRRRRLVFIMQTLLFLIASTALFYQAASGLPGRWLSTPRQTGTRNTHWRPQVHYSPPSQWMNDPNGLFLDSHGVWHLYYQYADSCSSPGAKNWGHATSTDLYTWQDHPVAIATSSELGSIYSGSVYVDVNNTSGLFPSGNDGKDNVLAYFTSDWGGKEDQSLVYSLDGGYTFSNYANNPIMDLNRGDFRDPKIVYHRESNTFMIVTTLLDRVSIWSSTDLLHWSEVSEYTTPSGGVECPQLIRIPRRDDNGAYLDTAWILVLSLMGGGVQGSSAVKYIVGNFDGKTFSPWGNTLYNYDAGPDVYASAFYHFETEDYDEGKRNAVSQSWAINTRYALSSPTCGAEGWEHVMTLPREHWLDSNYQLVSRPLGIADRQLPADAILTVQHSKADSSASWADLAAQSNPAISFNLTLRVSSNAAPNAVTLTLQDETAPTNGQLLLRFDLPDAGDAANGAPANISLTRSNVQPSEDYMATYTVAVPAVKSGSSSAWTVEGVLDRSIIEVYVNGGSEALTMVYFTSATVNSVQLHQAAEDGSASSGLSYDLSVMPLESVWGNGP